MLRFIDDQLNRLTMYKLVLWLLRILAGVAIFMSLIGAIGLTWVSLALSLVILMAVAHVANIIFARLWNIPANTESYAITLLILFFILPPATSLSRAVLIAIAAVIAIASKFILAYRSRHIFNPAAAAPAILGLIGLLNASWWVGSTALWPFTLVFGLLVVRKIRRFTLFFAFALASLIAAVFTSHSQGQTALQALQFTITQTPFLFLGTIMLTEPATMPARRDGQIIFAVIVGLLSTLPIRLSNFSFTPEQALLIGNIYAFAINPKYRLRLKLAAIQRVSERVYSYVFTPDRSARFIPGQYLEFTLDHKSHDSRGNRRTFSIASSPTESNIQIGLKFYTPPSSFKQALRRMQIGDVIYAGSLAGDFTLPHDTREKLVFIAGGIGITPFRSMLKYIIDKDEKRDIVIIYAVSDPHEVAFKDVLQQAAAKGIRVVPLLTSAPTPEWQGRTGKLTPELLAELIPDHQSRIFYLSGPQPLVESLKDTIKKLGAKKIRTDYFTGY